MTHPSTSGIRRFLACLPITALGLAGGLAYGAGAEIVPGTVSGNAGLLGEPVSSGQVYVSNSEFSGNTALQSDGTYSLTLQSPQVYTNATWYHYGYSPNYFQSSKSSSNLNIDLPEAGSVTADLAIASGTLVLDASVTEYDGIPTGSVNSAVLRASYYDGSGSLWGYAQGSGAIELPVGTGTGITVYGDLTVNVFDELGSTVLCTATLPIANQYLDVVEGGDTPVTVVADLHPGMCQVAIIGDVGITNTTPNTGWVNSGYPGYKSDSLSWADGNPIQSYEISGLLETTYRPYGYVYFTGAQSGDYLQMPYYDEPVVDLTNGGVERRDFLLDGAFVEGVVDVTGTAASTLTYGTQQFNGQWVWDPATQTYGPTAGGYASGPISVADGSYNATMTPGDWQGRTTLNFSDTYAGVPSYSYLYLYNGVSVDAVAGTTVQAPTQDVSVSQGTITFDVIEAEGEPTIGVTNPYVTASYYDSTTGTSISTQTYSYVQNAATPTVRVVGPAGTYTFTAYATVNNAQTTFAQSTITLGAAVGTPTGTDVVVVPEDANGDPTPITVTFGEVTEGGETTASLTDIGPGAPDGYTLLGIVDDDAYLNLSSSATFDEATVCVTYDADGLGLTEGEEAALVLQLFVCDDSGNCAWEVLEDGSVDTDNDLVCGTADELGTFGVTLPDAPLIEVFGNCVGEATAPVALTTDPGFCSVLVHADNGLAGDCSTDDLATCEFDGGLEAFLGLGDSTVGVLATGTDGSTDACDSYVTVTDDEAPSIACGADQVVECTGATTAATVSATCDDNCASCVASCGDAEFGFGDTTVTCNASDDANNTASCNSTVTVVDTTAPALSFTASPAVLWPPNHRMVAIALPTAVDEACDALPVVDCTVTSDEADEGLGDGDFENDIQWVDDALLLRAERSGLGDGRVYTITCTATDASGNASSAVQTVTVPFSQGNNQPSNGNPGPASNRVRGNRR